MTNDDHRCFAELAPLYALDLLDLEERLWVEAQVLACPDLAEELTSYQTAVGVIPYSAPAMPMAADLKDRLFDRLGLDPVAAIPAITPAIAPDPRMLAIRATDLDWQPRRIAGVQAAILFRDEVSRVQQLIVKAAAGVVYPLHQHAGIEEIYMLEGELIIDDQIYLAGDYIRSYPNSIHAPFTNSGCMFLIRACIDDNYDENLIHQLG
jgi:quercetin dioxygenase-like cupin family protein